MIIRNKVRGRSYHPNCGVIQGDPLSSLLFNVMIDIVLKIIDYKNKNLHVEEGIMDEENEIRSEVHDLPVWFRAFYADDGLIGNINLGALQERMKQMLEVMKSVGLQFNNQKTQWMICQPKTRKRRKFTGEGETQVQKKRTLLEFFGTEVNSTAKRGRLNVTSARKLLTRS